VRACPNPPLPSPDRRSPAPSKIGDTAAQVTITGQPSTLDEGFFPLSLAQTCPLALRLLLEAAAVRKLEIHGEKRARVTDGWEICKEAEALDAGMGSVFSVLDDEASRLHPVCSLFSRAHMHEGDRSGSPC
jgi:hypothetical protein